MIEFRTFGTLDLRTTGGPELSSLLAQPKRLALLGFLSIATPRGFHRRDKLLPLFWPEADQEHARTSLRKAVHVLRHSLGDRAVLARGDEEIGLNFDEVWCDVAAFEEACDAGAAQEALALYRGDLLSGLHLSGVPEFDRWLESERSRLRHRAQESARGLARRAEQEGDPQAAARSYRRALALFPDDEADLQALVRLLDRTGDRSGALREYDVFARRLSEELEIEPSLESRTLIQQIRVRAAPVGSKAVVSPSLEPHASHDHPPASKSTSRSRWLLAGAAAALALVGSMAALLSLNARRSPAPLDTRVVAVLPFRVRSADPGLGFLREGMMDLLSAKLSGTTRLRAVDTRTVLSHWRRAGGDDIHDLNQSRAVGVGRELGAGRVLQGEIVGLAGNLILSAAVTNVADGTQVRGSVETTYDSLGPSIDDLAAELLALEAGEPQHRLAALMSTSLPALREYVEGESALRRGAYADAVRRLDRALELDSTFAVAGIARTHAAIWIGEAEIGPGSLRAWHHRDRLAARDRAWLSFMMGPKYPYRSSEREWYRAAEAVVAAAPDDPQAWATLGDQLYHYGGLLGMSDALTRSARAYRRAIALDSNYLPGWEHLGVIVLAAGDSALARRVIRLRLQRDSVSPLAREDQWLGLRMLADSSLPPLALDQDSLVSHPNGLAWKAVDFSTALADVDSTLPLMLSRAQGADLEAAEIRARSYYLIRGWPSRARTAVGAALAEGGSRDLLILEALYADGDTTLARRLVRGASRVFSRPVSEREFAKVTLQWATAQFELSMGNADAARRAVRAWLVTPQRAETLVTAVAADCGARLLDAQLAALDRRPDARARLEELDSLLLEAPTGGDLFERIGNLEAARLWQERGETARALKSVRRRREGLQTYSELPRYLADEGRYAALMGDRDGARRAYRRYLLLRSHPELSLQSQVETVRAALVALGPGT